MPARTRATTKTAKKAPSKKKPAPKKPRAATKSAASKAAARKARAAAKTLTPSERERGGANRDARATAGHIVTPQDELAVREGCFFDEEAADRVVGFFQGNLMDTRHALGPQPLTLIEWQWNYLRTLYGWVRPDGEGGFRRRFTTGSCWVAKKNGKSLMNGGMALYGLCADGEPMPEVYLAAADREQAGIVFREAVAMVENSPLLREILDVIKSTKRIVYPRVNGFVRALSRESSTSEGINASEVIVDELHAHRDAALFDALKFAGAARRQPLTSVISTAGVKDITTVGWREYQYARQVRDGLIPDSSLLPYIFEAPPEAAVDDPAAWRAANPSLGITLSMERFAEDAREARNDPGKLNAFRRYRLNQWTAQDFSWITDSEWMACEGEPHEADPDVLAGRPCYLGLDMASTQDTTSATLVFPPQGPDESWAVIPHVFVPEDIVEKKSRAESVPYAQWVRQGLLRTTPGNATDYATVRKFVLDEARAAYDLREVAIDLWNAAQLAQDLMEEGVEVTGVRPTFKDMSPPSKLLETLVAGRRIAHGGHPVLRWMMSNVQAEMDVHENIRPAKHKSKGKIDGVVALLMAMARAMVADEKPQGVFVL